MPNRALVLALTLSIASAAPALRAQNPVPLINQPPVPAGIAPGHPGFKLTIYGSGFATSAVVNWNGSARTTVFGSSSMLTAEIRATDLATPSTASITVVNPAPGGGSSNVVLFGVTDPVTTVAFSPLHYAGYTGSFQGIATADVNHDGKLDLVLIGPAKNTITVMLGNGDGTFRTPQSIEAGVQPECIALADFNGDGNLDVVMTGSQAQGSVLLGDGDGTFQPYQLFTTNYESDGLAIGDFNRDGKLDLATANIDPETSEVSILLGNGDGTFQASVDYPAGAGLNGNLYTGDFDSDGKLDLAVPGYDGANFILFGNGDGSFQSAITIPGSFQLEAIGDFNADGILDLAGIPFGAGNTALILLGNGDGTFQSPRSSVVGPDPFWMATGDFNGDGKLDLAVTVGGNLPEEIAILFGNGDGSFEPPVASMAQLQPEYLIAGDFNGDGKLDLATTSSSNPGTTLAVLLQTTVALSPESLILAPQLLGTTSTPTTVTLTNNGASALSVASVSLSGTNAGDFAIGNDRCSGTNLPAAGACTFTISFTPGAQGTRMATVSVADDAPASPQQLSITGYGTVLEFSQDDLNFGAVKIGSASSPKVVVVTNTGTAQLQLRIAVDGADPGDFIEDTSCGEYLNAGTSCTVEVTFTPTADGTRVAYVNVGYSKVAPTRIHLKGIGT